MKNIKALEVTSKQSYPPLPVLCRNRKRPHFPHYFPPTTKCFFIASVIFTILKHSTGGDLIWRLLRKLNVPVWYAVL